VFICVQIYPLLLDVAIYSSNRATREGCEISVTNDGILTTDGTHVFGLQDGLLQPRHDG
jgi:hypothetical protein